MSEWKEINIGKHLDLISGFAFKSVDFLDDKVEASLPVVKIKNVANGDVNLNDVVYHKYDDKLEKFLLAKGDILIAMTGNHPQAETQVVGDVSKYKLDEKALLNQRVGKLVVKDDSSLDFFYYLFKNDDVRNLLANKSSGSANQANISKADILGLNVNMPNPNEQAAIAEVLSSLDDKIDLLHRQNKTLEQLAETLFKQWFTERAEGKPLIALEELVDTINGVSYKSSELNPSKVGMVSLKSFDRKGGFRNDGFKEFTGKYKEKQIVEQGDLIVAHTDITQKAEVIGNPALVIGDSKYDTLVISMDLVKVVPKVDWVSIEFLYYLMKTKEFKGHCEGNANGSTVIHLSKRAIPTFEFAQPEEDKVVEFTRQARNIIQKSFSNHSQIKTLTQLRDSLLPKLMSGEMRVNNTF